MPPWAWVAVAWAAGAGLGLVAYACLTAARRVRVLVTAAAILVLVPTALAGVAYGGYWAIDTTNVLDGIGLNGARHCDDFDSHPDAQKELGHEIRHHDQGSIRALDPDGNHKACDGWNHHDADRKLAKGYAPSSAGAGCDPNYTGGCVPDTPYDVDCADVDGSDLTVVGEDVDGLDRDGDGVACESY